MSGQGWFKGGIGYFSGIGYCVTTAASVVGIAAIDQKMNAFLALLLTFVYATAWFWLINYRTMPMVLKKALGAKRAWLVINITTAGNWLATFLALNDIDPVLYLAIFMSLLPLFTYLIQCCYGRLTLKPQRLFRALGILVIIAALMHEDLVQHFQHDLWGFWRGVGYTALGSLSAAFYMVHAKTMQTRLKLSSSQMLALRFILLLGILVVWCFYQGDFVGLRTAPYGQLFLLALVTAILPLFFMQFSLVKVGALALAFVMTLTPIFTVLLEVIIAKQAMSWLMFFVLLLLTFMLIWDVMAKDQ